MRQTFTITFLGDDQTAQTIVVNSKKGLIPTQIEEYRGKKGNELYYESHVVNHKTKYVTWVCNADWEVRKVSDFGIKTIQPRKWWQIWRRK